MVAEGSAPRARHAQVGVRAGLPVGVTAGVMATAVLPLLVMFPSMGYGLFGFRSGEAARLNRIMLLGHVAFGAGIGCWTSYFEGRRSPR